MNSEIETRCCVLTVQLQHLLHRHCRNILAKCCRLVHKFLSFHAFAGTQFYRGLKNMFFNNLQKTVRKNKEDKTTDHNILQFAQHKDSAFDNTVHPI